MKTSPNKAAALFLLALTAAHAARAQEAPPPPVIIQTQPAASQPAPAATQPAPAAQPPAQPGSPGTRITPGAAPSDAARAPSEPITGRVVGDAGEPMSGVAVYAIPRGAAPAAFRTPNTATTDEGGNFKLTGLAPGLYQINANPPAYVSEPDPLTGRPPVFRPGDTALLRLTKGGVVTGTITDQQGEPLVGVAVRAVRVRDLDGRAPQTPFPPTVEDRADDRGVYRIYGLTPGVYVVYAGGGLSPSFFSPVAPYSADAPTFYPSGTRDTAAEVTVRAGQETAGIDIRYREEQGRRVTGTVEVAAAVPADSGVSVSLGFASSGMPAGNSGVNPNSPDRSFSIEGVADGEYDLQAMMGGREGTVATSAPQRVSVRGADVTGLKLVLAPLASASGALAIEPAPEAERAGAECKALRPAARRPQETLVALTLERPGANRPLSRLAVTREAAPDESGAFTLRSLEAGRYHVSARIFDEALYLRAVQLPAPAPPAPTRAAGAASPRASTAAATRAVASPAPAPASREVFDLKTGQQFTGIGVRLSEGAASFAGRVVTAEATAAQTPAPNRVHLVPQERERAEDPLRYYEAPVAPEGSFAFKNLAPGRYLVLARAEAEAGDGASPRPAALDAGTRAALRREAESANTAAELRPCQRTADFTLRFPPPPK